MSRKSELHKLMQQEKLTPRRELEFQLDGVTYVVNVPAHDTQDQNSRSDTAIERAAMQLSVLRAIRMWIKAPEAVRDIELNITNFCQDVLILWYLGDNRVTLRNKKHADVPCSALREPQTYWMHIESESNAQNVPASHHRMTIARYADAQFYIPDIAKKLHIADIAEYRRQAFADFATWRKSKKEVRDAQADEIIGRFIQLWHHGDPEVHIE